MSTSDSSLSSLDILPTGFFKKATGAQYCVWQGRPDRPTERLGLVKRSVSTYLSVHQSQSRRLDSVKASPGGPVQGDVAILYLLTNMSWIRGVVSQQDMKNRVCAFITDYYDVVFTGLGSNRRVDCIMTPRSIFKSSAPLKQSVYEGSTHCAQSAR